MCQLNTLESVNSSLALAMNRLLFLALRMLPKRKGRKRTKGSPMPVKQTFNKRSPLLVGEKKGPAAAE